MGKSLALIMTWSIRIAYQWNHIVTVRAIEVSFILKIQISPKLLDLIVIFLLLVDMHKLLSCITNKRVIPYTKIIPWNVLFGPISSLLWKNATWIWGSLRPRHDWNSIFINFSKYIHPGKTSVSQYIDKIFNNLSIKHFFDFIRSLYFSIK